MESYLIIYEATNNQAPAIVQYMKSHGTWGKITANSWVIKSSKRATQIRDEVKSINGVKRVFVLKSGVIAAWSDVHANSEWLKRNL